MVVLSLLDVITIGFRVKFGFARFFTACPVPGAIGPIFTNSVIVAIEVRLKSSSFCWNPFEGRICTLARFFFVLEIT